MNKLSTRQRPWHPPKLERLLIDADVNARLIFYLKAVGFDVLFAPTILGLDVHNDPALVQWARRHRRIVVCHDRFKDQQTKLRMLLEVYENGGKIIQIRGEPGQPVLTSLGKILVNRPAWTEFFAEHTDGIAKVHGQGMNPYPPERLHRDIQRMIVDPIAALERPRRASKRRARLPNPAQGRLV